MNDYLTLAIGAPRRLAILKRAADKLNARTHNARKATGNPEPYTWRDMRYCSFKNARAARCELSPGRQDGRPIWYAHTGQQFPRERYADEIVSINHSGWYTDCDGRETARGLVVALPHGRFLAGYHWSDNGERVYFPDLYDCEDAAARAADSEAASFAELCREDDYQYQQARKLEDEIEGNFSRLRECLALRNRECFAHLREEARELIASIKEARETLRTEYAAYI